MSVFKLTKWQKKEPTQNYQNVEKHLTIKGKKRIMKKVEKRELNKKLRTKGANS